MEDLPERFSVNLARLHWDRRLNRDKAEFTQVREKDADYPERKFDVGSDIYHRRRCLREVQHRKVFRTKSAWVCDPGLSREHRSDYVEGLARGPRPALCQLVRPDNGSGLLV